MATLWKQPNFNCIVNIYSHTTREMSLKEFLFSTDRDLNNNSQKKNPHNLLKYRDHSVSSPNDTSTIQILHLRLGEHHGRKKHMDFKKWKSGTLQWDCILQKWEASSKNNTWKIWLSKQDQRSTPSIDRLMWKEEIL